MEKNCNNCNVALQDKYGVFGCDGAHLQRCVYSPTVVAFPGAFDNPILDYWKEFAPQESAEAAKRSA